MDGFILETFSDLDEIAAAYRAVRGVADLPVIAQMTVGEDGTTRYGASSRPSRRELTSWAPT